MVRRNIHIQPLKSKCNIPEFAKTISTESMQSQRYYKGSFQQRFNYGYPSAAANDPGFDAFGFSSPSCPRARGSRRHAGLFSNLKLAG
jgi:hypothetical protein